MANMDICDALIQQLNTEYEFNLQLKAILLKEKNALRENSKEPLEPVAKEKRMQVDTIKSCAAKREQLLASQGLSNTAKGIHVLINRCPREKRDAVNKAWDKLLALFHTCQRQNAFNRALININYNSLNTVNPMLIKHNPNNTKSTYGNNGLVIANKKSVRHIQA